MKRKLVGRLSVLAAVAAVLAWAGLSGCSRGQAGAKPVSVTVLAAASLADAFWDLGRRFETSHPGVKVEFSFAGSNQLRLQLEQGGPGDVFASADRKQMDAAVAAGKVPQEAPVVFARNRLVVITPAANPGAVASVADLARKGIRLVVADKAVPAGSYTAKMLEAAARAPELGKAFVEGFEGNVVSREQSVAGVVAKVRLGEADAGLAYASDAAGGAAGQIRMLELPDSIAQRAEYVIGVTVNPTGEAKARAGEFVGFVCSQEGEAVLKQFGFAPAGGAGP